MKFVKITPLIILLIALIPRLLFLNQIPIGINPDELHFILNAKAVFYNFSDMSGRWNPLSFATIPDESSSELPFIIIAPIIGPLPTNLLTARLPFVLASSFTVLLLYLIAKKLFPQPSISYLVVITASLNPWSIYTSRTSFDATLAIFFYVLTLYLLISQKGQKILLAFIPAAAAFYCYIGTKILLIPFIVAVTIYAWKFQRQSKDGRYYFILNLLTILLVISFLSQLHQGGLNRRTQELTSLSSPTIIDQVSNQRSQAIDSPLKTITSNKYTAYASSFLNKYLNNFSPDILFLHGDHTFMVSLWQHGYFYIVDFFLIFLGLCYLFSSNKRLFILISFLILISPLPEAIRSDPLPAYAFHSSFQYPFLFILTGLGAYAVGKLFSTRLLQISTGIFLLLVYLLSFSYLIYIYFLRYPIYQPEGFSFSKRVLAHYLALQAEKSPVYVVTNEPDTVFRSYLFYHNLYQKNNFSQIKEQYLQPSRTNFDIGQIHITNNVKNLPSDSLYTLIVDSASTPIEFSGQQFQTIFRLSDKAPLYSIYRPTVCNSFSSEIIPNFQFSDFNISSLSPDRFCSLFIKQS